MLLVACSAEHPTGTAAPDAGATSRLHPMAFTATIDTRTNRVSITPPSSGSTGARAASAERPDGLSLSLLAGDVVRMVTSNYRESAVGAYSPNKIRVRFDLAIENRLPGIRLVTPTWPVAPADGVIVFPIDYTVTVAPGTVIGGSGTTVLVEQPRFGAVSPSADFDGTGAPGSGAPYNFFNDADCAAAEASDCFRWKAFETGIAPGGSSSRRTVGFDIDPSVAQFRVRMIVAADLAPASSPTDMRVSALTTRVPPAPSSAVPGPPASPN